MASIMKRRESKEINEKEREEFEKMKEEVLKRAVQIDFNNLWNISKPDDDIDFYIFLFDEVDNIMKKAFPREQYDTYELDLESRDTRDLKLVIEKLYSHISNGGNVVIFWLADNHGFAFAV